MKLKYQDFSEFIVAEKPYGVPTHQVDEFKPGFKEYLEEKLGIKLGIVSRLDSSTSGLLFFPKLEFTSLYNQVWTTDAVTKTYLFLTDRSVPNSEHPIQIKTLIEKNGKNWLSTHSEAPNSSSVFTFVKKIPHKETYLYLWRVQITTGKTHQIRLHAQNLGIPILGDSLYGGTTFYRLMLHSSELKIRDLEIKSQTPFWTEDLDSFEIKSEIEKRSSLYNVDPAECFRWLNNEIPGVVMDQFGDYLYLYDYTDSSPAKNLLESDLTSVERIAEFLSSYFQKSIFVKTMLNRGKTPHTGDLKFYDSTGKNWSSDAAPKNWFGVENEVHYNLKSNQGQSPGLFLDQAENRLWVKEHSEEKSVLNLFSYTSGFSLCAALGRAKSVCTVDVSASFLEWSKSNFIKNSVNLDPQFEFWKSDVLFFLKSALRKNRKWDLIICDPPTFGRSPEGVFRIEKDIDELILNCLGCLNSKGKILFSTNFEGWDFSEFYSSVHKIIRTKGLNCQILPSPIMRYDCGLGASELRMKSLIISLID